MQKKSSAPLPTELSADTHVYKINDFLLKHFGVDWLSWLPETTWQMLGGYLPRLLKDKILALRAAQSTNFPWTEWDIFENTGLAFNDTIANISVMEVLSPGECLTTILALNRIREEPFSGEVQSYAANCFFNEGMVACGIASIQPRLDELYEQGKRSDKAFADKVSRTFALVWPRRNEIEIDDDSILDCQVRKLIQTYTYVEEWRQGGL